MKIIAFATVASLGAVAFHYFIHFLFHNGIERFAKLPFPTFVWTSLISVVGTALIAGWLLTFVCKDAAGSGIPQLKAA